MGETYQLQYLLLLQYIDAVSEGEHLETTRIFNIQQVTFTCEGTTAAAPALPQAAVRLRRCIMGNQDSDGPLTYLTEHTHLTKTLCH